MTTLELEARLDNLLATAQAETARIDLFAPIPEREECPICLLPLPIDKTETVFMTCCGKHICSGCIHKSFKRDGEKGVQQNEIKCAFCRQLTPMNEVKANKKLMKKNNPRAFMQMAAHYKRGDGVFQSDTKALEMITRAAELGSAQAFTKIGYYYLEGFAVRQDSSKALEYYEIGAKKGSVYAQMACYFSWEKWEQ